MTRNVRVTSADARPFQPHSVQESRLLPVKHSNAEWRYIHAPGSWQWSDEKGAFLPVLGRMVLEPGMNGTVASRSGPPSPSTLRAKMDSKGCVEIQVGDPRLGEHADYLVSYACEGGRKSWQHAGVAFEFTGPGRARMEKLDPKVYADFLHACLAVTGDPPDSAMADLIERYQRRLDRMAARDGAAVKGSLTAQRIVADTERLAGMEKERARITAERDKPRKATGAKPAKQAFGGKG